MKNIFVASIAALALSASMRAETIIEVNVADIKKYEAVEIFRYEGGVGTSVFCDSVRDGQCSFLYKCENFTEDIYYGICLSKRYVSRLRDVYILPDTKAVVTGSGDYPNYWNVTSQHPRQEYSNRKNEFLKELGAEYQDNDTATTMEGKIAQMPRLREVIRKRDAQDLVAMREMPVDEYWLMDYEWSTRIVSSKSKDDPERVAIQELYDKLSESDKATPIGRRITENLFGELHVPDVGDKFKDYDMYDAAGNVHHLADYDGKWRVVDFGSYHCGPCRMVLPVVKYLYQRGIDKKLEIITVTKDTRKQFEEMAANESYVSPLWNDHEGEDGIFSEYRIDGFPSFYVIKPDGTIAKKWKGANEIRILNVVKEADAFPEPVFKTENGVTKIVSPAFVDFHGILVDEIEIHRDSVVLNCTVPRTLTKYNIASTSGLYVNGLCVSRIIGSSIGLDKTVSVPMGELGHCRLTFEPLPSGTASFDFIESQSDTAFRVIGLNVAE